VTADTPAQRALQRIKPSSSTVASAAIGAPAGIVVVWMVREFAGVDMPAEVAAAVGSIVSFVVGYFFYGGRSDETI